MEKIKFKKGDIVYWQDLQGEVMDTDDDGTDFTITVRFTNGKEEYFTIDGRVYTNTPPVLSHTPYTLNGFTQNEVIEKDTLVWVKHEKDGEWKMRYYSHFENGKHYCFIIQLTSKQTDELINWNLLYLYLISW